MHTNERYLHTHTSMQNVMITKTKESIYSLFQNSPHVHTTRERTFTKQICYITICFSGIWEKVSKVYRYSLYHIYKEKRLYFDDIKSLSVKAFYLRVSNFSWFHYWCEQYEFIVLVLFVQKTFWEKCVLYGNACESWKSGSTRNTQRQR